MKYLLLFTLLLAINSVYCQQTTEETLKELREIKDRSLLESKLSALRAGSETEMITLLRYYNTQAAYDERDSLQKMIVARFPSGTVAYEAFGSRLFSESDLDRKEEMFKEAVILFPDRDMDRFRLSLGQSYINALDFKKAKELSGSIRNAETLAMLAGSFEKKGTLLADSLMRSAIEIQRQDSSQKKVSSNLLYQYSMLLQKQERFDEAIEVARESYTNLERENENIASNYASLLTAKGNYLEAVNVLSGLIVKIPVREEVKSELRKVYRYAHPQSDVDSYMDSLRNVYLGHLKSELKQKMFNRPAHSILGKDSRGKTAKLKDFKGKILVLDFWATWCVPCKASFPAMQAAVNKYTGDPEVEFLFIHTSDNTDDPLKDATAYLQDHKFTFNLLMDYRDPQTKKSPVAGSFGVRSLPTKLIVDGGGRVRFAVSGYYGNNEAVVDEISTMIQLLREETRNDQ